MESKTTCDTVKPKLNQQMIWFIPGSSFLAASSAILSSGPEQGQPGSSSIPARPANRWADSRPPTTSHTHTQRTLRLLKRKFQRDTEKNPAPLRTSDVGFKHGRVDVDVKVHGVLEERRHALKLRVVSQNLWQNSHMITTQLRALERSTTL